MSAYEIYVYFCLWLLITFVISIFIDVIEDTGFVGSFCLCIGMQVMCCIGYLIFVFFADIIPSYFGWI